MTAKKEAVEVEVSDEVAEEVIERIGEIKKRMTPRDWFELRKYFDESPETIEGDEVAMMVALCWMQNKDTSLDEYMDTPLTELQALLGIE